MTTLFQICTQENPDIKELKLLLEYGANMGEKDNDGWTPLHKASDRGYLEIVKLLENCKIAKIRELEKYIYNYRF